ncbi:MAG TPA: hypothetical protein VGG44_03580, partial [Tepidisphaeraceae bacterium]
SNFGFTVLVIGAGAVIVAMMLSRRRTWASLAMAVWLLIAVVPLELVRPQKEIIVIFLTAVVLLTMRKLDKQYLALPAIALLYLAYSYLGGRDYYFLITGAIFAIFALSNIGWPFRFVILLAVFCAGWLIPQDVLLSLSQTRNDLNVIRVLFPDMPGARTAFLNPLIGEDWLSFLGNYAYGALRLNVPILFTPGISEAFLFFYCSSIFYLIAIGLRRSVEWQTRFSACAVAGHLVVLWLFDPDLGSYLRHVASTTLYLMPILNKLDRTSSGSVRQPSRLAGSSVVSMRTSDVSTA